MGGTTNLTPGTPTFGSYAELSARGSSVPVGVVDGVVYGWSGTQGMHVAQKARAPQIPRRGKLAILGSSTVANGVITVGGEDTVSYRGVAGYLDSNVGQRYDIKSFGYSGQTTDVIRTHISDVIAWGADICILEYGMNSITSAADAEIDLPKLQADCERLIASGITPVIWGIWMSTTKANVAGASAQNILAQEWALYRGIPFFSGLRAIADKASPACNPTAKALSDGLHQASLGARLIGNSAASALDCGHTWEILPCGDAQTPYEVFSNPLMTGSEAVATDGFTGTVSTSWVPKITNKTPTGSLTTGIETGYNAAGYLQNERYTEVTISAKELGAGVSLGQTLRFAKFLPGVTYRGYADFKIVSGAEYVRTIQMFLPFNGHNMSHPNGNYTNWVDGTYENGKRYKYRTPPFTRGSSVALDSNPGLSVNASAEGTIVIRIYGISCRESRW